MDATTLYHRLPYPLKVAAAGLRGAHLERWRYGRETERLVEEAFERERWSPSRWRAWREARLASLLDRAAARVPHYRELWRQRPGTPGELAAWPLLAKEALRRDPAAFLADDVRRSTLFEEHTSGTTGTPLTLYWSRATVRAWYALFEARIRRWHGLDRHARWAHLGGQLVAAPARRRPPYWVWNAPMHQLYLSSYHLSPATAPSYLEAIRRRRVEYLFGYSSSLASLASFVVEARLAVPPLRLAVTNAEPLFDHQRQLIGEAFGCPVRETYGMAEIAVAASECQAGRLHLWPEVGHVEILDDASPRPLETGRSGRLIATGLVNADMPLIRYETGDRAVLADEDAGCACGRRLPQLARLEGRCDDVLRCPDGRRVGRLDPVFKTDLPIREAQIVQTEIDRVRVLVVPAAGFDERCAGRIVRRLRDRLGGVRVEVEPVATIPRSAGGKLRAVVSRLPRG